MENNLKDMIKNLKAKTSKMLEVEPKSYGDDEEKTVQKTKKEAPKKEALKKTILEENPSGKAMVDDIEARIAKFYLDKEEKISALEKEESLKGDTITKKISDSEYKSVISGIKVDTEEDEEENIGRRVLREFMLDDDDFENEGATDMGMKATEDESDTFVDIASNSTSESKEKAEEVVEDETFDTVVDIVSNSDPIDIVKLPKAPNKENDTDNTKERLEKMIGATSKLSKSVEKSKNDKKVVEKELGNVETTTQNVEIPTEDVEKSLGVSKKVEKDTKKSVKTKAVSTSKSKKVEKSTEKTLATKKASVEKKSSKKESKKVEEIKPKEELVKENEPNDKKVEDVIAQNNTRVETIIEPNEKVVEEPICDLPSFEPAVALYGSDEHISENKNGLGVAVHSKEVEVGDKHLNSDIHNATPSSMVVPMGEEEVLSEPEKFVKEVESIHTMSGVESTYKPEQKKPMKVLFVVTECQPFVATGGLADVAGSLPKAIAKEGVDIRVIMPLYGTIKDTYRSDFEFVGSYTVHLSWRQEYCGLFRYVSDGVTYYFVDNERYFKRDNLYGYFDDGERFAYFCKAVVEGLPSLDFFPNIIHCNDWQSALVSTYLKTGSWSDNRYYHIKNIYTIHNVEYQGVYGMENLGDLFGVDLGHAHDLEYDGNINLTKGAIQLGDKVTTVSHSYCDNLKQPYCSRGLHHIIYRNEYKLSGIMNGVDNDFYNPETDEVIACNYSINDLSGKAECKKAWQEELGLPVDPDTPLISMVTRLVSHKGLDLITRILEDLVQDDIQFVIVGTGDQRFIDYFKYMEEKYPTKVRALVNKFSLEYARKNYAGSDIFLMPSKIEPCGISQMIASRYGAVPVVRETGGLKDSIKDFGCEGGGNGYTFANYNSEDLKYQVKRAIADYRNPSEWSKKVHTVMGINFGWEKSAKEYVQLYESVM